jgi:hypothetical protein
MVDLGVVLADVNLVVDIVVLCVMVIQQKGMGVPALPSGVFRLRSGPA